MEYVIVPYLVHDCGVRGQKAFMPSHLTTPTLMASLSRVNRIQPAALILTSTMTAAEQGLSEVEEASDISIITNSRKIESSTGMAV
jgi:hypothetical protein